MPSSATRPPGLNLALHATTVALVSLCGWVWLLWIGPKPVVRGTIALSIEVPFWYMFLAFPVLGALVAEVLEDLLARRWWAAGVLSSQIGAMVLLSNLRLGLLLPISGHALLFFFAALRWGSPRGGGGWPKRIKLALIIPLCLLAGWIKLVWWRDPLTLGVGMVLAGLIALAGGRTAKAKIPSKPAY